MKCPHCQHNTNDKALLQCSHCGEAFERGPFEEYQHLRYLANWLADRPEISYSQIKALLDVVEKKQDSLIKQLLPKVETPPAPAITKDTKPEVEKAPTAPMPAPLPKPEPTPIPAPASIIKPVTASVPVAAPVAPQPVPAAPAKPIAAPQQPPAPPKPVAIPKPPAPPKPVAPPKPKKPPVDWGKVITDAATSGALLRALLYLGAFMIVVSAAVLVIVYWNVFKQWQQLLIIASVPMLFYAGGWFIRTRMKLIQAGTVLTGIGATLVAVDFGAIYQLGNFSNGPVYWLIASIFCTALYVFTATRIKGEFFAYLTLIGGGGVLFAFASLFKLPLQWEVVSVTISGAIMTLLIARFNKGGEMTREFARAARYLPQILMPISVWYVSYSPSQPPTAQMTAFLFATLGYSVLAWQIPTLIFAYTALGASLGAVLFALRVFDLPIEWYAAVASVLAMIYILIGQRITRAQTDSKITETYVKALQTTGFTLIALAAIGGLIFSLNGDTWAGVTGMTLAALDLAICAYLFQQSIFTIAASGLFILPYSIALLDHFHASNMSAALSLTWLTFAWHSLSLLYITLAAFLNKAEKHNVPLYSWAHILTPIAMLLLPFGYYADVKGWTSAPTLSSLDMAVIVYLFSFILQDSKRHATLNKLSALDLPFFGNGNAIFLWMPALLIPIETAIAWRASNQPAEWFGAILSGIGLVYVAIGQGLFRRAKEYRLPLHIYPYFLFVIGIPLAAGNQYALLTSLAITVASLGWLAYIYNRVTETALAGLLTVWLFTVALGLIKLPRESYSLAFIVFACLVYIPVAIRLNKFQNSREHLHPLPIFIIGYVLSAYALIDSILGSIAGASMPWISALVPLIVTGLYVFSEWYFKDEKYSLGWAWLAAITFAITFRQTITLFHLKPVYDPLAWVFFAAFYMIVDRVLAKISGVGQLAVQISGSKLPESKPQGFWLAKFHLPLVSGLIILSALSLFLNLPATFAAFNGAMLKEYLPVILAQSTLVILAIVSARVYQTRLPIFIEPALAFLPVTLFFIGYGKTLFGASLTTPQYAYAWTGLGILHFITAIFTDRAKVRYAHGFYLGAYALITWSVLWSIPDTTTLTWTFGLWVVTSIISAVLIHFGRHQTWSELGVVFFGNAQGNARVTFINLFQWLAAWTFPLWCVIFLRQINISDAYSWLGFSIPALAYIGLALWLKRINNAYAFPLDSASQFFSLAALIITAAPTMQFLLDTPLERHIALASITIQLSVVVSYTASAWKFKSRLFAHLAAWLSLIPVSMAWKLFDPSFEYVRFAIPWLLWSLILLGVGFALDKNQTRYSHGAYLAGYALITAAAVWSILERSILVWTFGSWIFIAILSAILVHFGRHQTWNEVGKALFGSAQNDARVAFTNLFQWLAAWTFPIWCVIFLYEINVLDAFTWLGFAIPPLAYLGLALWLRRINAAYASPLFIPAQFYTAIALLISAPVTFEFFGGNYTGIERSILLANILIQTVGAIFYIASAQILESRGFSHIASWLSIIPFTIAWRTYGFEFTYLQFVIPWLLWSTLLIGIGFALDKNKVRYSHGPYTAGYLLSGYALIVSVTHRITNIYALAITIALALVSHIVIHYGRHHTYEDFILRFWQKTDETTRKIASTFFLFFAAYATPVLIAQLLAHLKFELAWRGVTLAIAAPLYIAIGLWTSHKESRSIATVPSWALYSAGYLLTAIGAMVSFENEMLATWVLVLNTVVYGVSAYIFGQAFWLYLSTILTPIIALLILHQTDHFTSNWSSWIFIGIAYLYLAIGQLFDRIRTATLMSQHDNGDMNIAIHPFASAFYAPGFLLSAIALALSSNDRTLALQIYSAGAILYAVSGWLFKETLFIYPAAWLAAVPYYLTITLTSLETRWYGLAWLPLIIAYIAIGKFVFHKQPLAKLGQGMLAQWLMHPAIPFYLLAYALSISMISLSYVNPLAITIAFGVATLLYFGSAFLFRAPGWMYASIFTAHMTLLTYFTIDPKGGEAYYLSIPFHALSWLMALLGFGFSRWITESNSKLVLSEVEVSDNDAHHFTLIEKLLGHPWARPFFVFTLFDILVWQSIALYGYQTTLIVALGNMLLFALFSVLWSQGALVYGAIIFGLLATGSHLQHAEFGFSNSLAVYGGIGFGLYLLARVIEPISARFKAWTVWLTPLTRAAIALTALAVIVNIPFMGSELVANAATLAFAGALYVTMAYREKQYVLGYLGMALLEAAWVIVLFLQNVRQPQFYAIPGGLYFMAVAYLELQRERKRYATAIEILGIGVLMVPTFIQALNGKEGFPYFVILMLEALLVLWWGALQKRKIPFFAGIGASVLNVFAQVIVLYTTYDKYRWFMIFGVGLAIMVMAIYIERSREQLRARAQELSETLEKWE